MFFMLEGGQVSILLY